MTIINTSAPAAEYGGHLPLHALLEGGFVERWTRLLSARHSAADRSNDITVCIVDTIVGASELGPRRGHAPEAHVEAVFERARAAVAAMLGTPIQTPAAAIAAQRRAERAAYNRQANTGSAAA